MVGRVLVQALFSASADLVGEKITCNLLRFTFFVPTMIKSLTVYSVQGLGYWEGFLGYRRLST